MEWKQRMGRGAPSDTEPAATLFNASRGFNDGGRSSYCRSRSVTCRSSSSSLCARSCSITQLHATMRNNCFLPIAVFGNKYKSSSSSSSRRRNVACARAVREISSIEVRAAHARSCTVCGHGQLLFPLISFLIVHVYVHMYIHAHVVTSKISQLDTFGYLDCMIAMQLVKSS